MCVQALKGGEIPTAALTILVGNHCAHIGGKFIPKCVIQGERGALIQKLSRDSKVMRVRGGSLIDLIFKKKFEFGIRAIRRRYKTFLALLALVRLAYFKFRF